MILTCVEVVQTTCCSYAHLEPLFPGKGIVRGLIEVVAEGTICHVLVNKYHLTLIISVSNERHKVHMTKLRKHLDLCHKLMSTLSRFLFHALDCHHNIA